MVSAACPCKSQKLHKARNTCFQGLSQGLCCPLPCNPCWPCSSSSFRRLLVLRIACHHFNIDHGIRSLITPSEIPESHLYHRTRGDVGLRVGAENSMMCADKSGRSKWCPRVCGVLLLSYHNPILTALSRAHFPLYTLLRYSNTSKQNHPFLL